MNCTEARVLLAVYRELKEDCADTAALAAHLEQCEDCRRVLADFQMVAEQLQSLPAIEPPPELRERLMRALAAEHLQFLQRAAPEAPPLPQFLAPYLREHLQQQAARDPLATLATAKTGPLPPIPATPAAAATRLPKRARPSRRRSSMPQLAALSMAAMLLLTLLTGGLTSLLLLAQNTPPSIPPPESIHYPTNVVIMRYASASAYTNIVSAVADGNSIYYTAYSDAPTCSWMLLRLDRRTQQSQPLLSTAVSSPLIILGGAQQWLVWLQFDPPTSTLTRDHKESIAEAPLEGLRTWSLHLLSWSENAAAPPEDQVILSGTFNAALTPSFVHTPVPGIWFLDHALLVAAIDENGISHLWRYDLQTSDHFARSEIAVAPPGHVYTSPTATADGSAIFWADEWLSSTGLLQSNIWTQQQIPVPGPERGRWLPHTAPQTWLFRSDGTSFRPLVVANTFFMLNTNDSLDGTAAFATPTATPRAAAGTASSPRSLPLNPAVTPWVSASIYQPSLDFFVSGSLYMLSLNVNASGTFSQLNTVTHVSALQGGATFVLWQNDNNTYGMFDVESNIFVQVGSALNGAQFVFVNGNSTTWSDDSTAGSATTAGTALVSLKMFSWPASSGNGH